MTCNNNLCNLGYWFPDFFVGASKNINVSDFHLIIIWAVVFESGISTFFGKNELMVVLVRYRYHRFMFIITVNGVQYPHKLMNKSFTVKCYCRNAFFWKCYKSMFWKKYFTMLSAKEKYDWNMNKFIIISYLNEVIYFSYLFIYKFIII